MIWHYALNGERRGPVSEDELQRLVQQGVVTPNTLVWREGMADWAAYQERNSNPAPVAAAPRVGVVCAGCGRLTPHDDVVEIGGFQYCAACKPRALQRLMGAVDDFHSPAEETRKLHLKHEASIKSIGLLYYLGATALLFGGAAMLIATALGTLSPRERPESLFLGALFVALAVLYFFVGAGLRRLRSWARTVAGILCGLGLLGFPIGTLINGYFLYLLFSQKGTVVFSSAYQEVIRQTPHLKYKTSIVVWIVIGLVVLAFVSIVAVGVISKH